MFEVTIKTIVGLPGSDEEGELEVIYDDDVIHFVLDGTLLFSGDWTGNFLPVFNLATDMWEQFALPGLDE